MEWHVGGNHIEVEIDGEGEAHVLAQARDGTYVTDDIVTPDDPDVDPSGRHH